MYSIRQINIFNFLEEEELDRITKLEMFINLSKLPNLW